MLLTPGTLWARVLERTEHARQRGAIQSIPTEHEFVEQNGVAFLVRIVSALAKKAERVASQPTANPFLPHDPDLFVADLSRTHLVLLNKFNVVESHLLIVTRAFEEQESLLTVQDFEALLACLAEIDGLGFYNAGKVAGASQRHKHLQLVPFPLAPTGPKVPIEPLFGSVRWQGPTGIIPGLPFRHAFGELEPRWIERPEDSAPDVIERYHAMLRAVGLLDETPPGNHQRARPYNLLLTRQWLLLVPRRAECFEGISINALGFAGALLVRDGQQLQTLKRHGPMTALKAVAFPSDQDTQVGDS